MGLFLVRLDTVIKLQGEAAPRKDDAVGSVRKRAEHMAPA